MEMYLKGVACKEKSFGNREMRKKVIHSNVHQLIFKLLFYWCLYIYIECYWFLKTELSGFYAICICLYFKTSLMHKYSVLFYDNWFLHRYFLHFLLVFKPRRKVFINLFDVRFANHQNLRCEKKFQQKKTKTDLFLYRAEIWKILYHCFRKFNIDIDFASMLFICFVYFSHLKFVA